MGWVSTETSWKKQNKEKESLDSKVCQEAKMEPAVKLSDGSCTVLGRRGIFLEKDTQGMAQLLNCRKKKKAYKEGEQKIYIHT